MEKGQVVYIAGNGTSETCVFECQFRALELGSEGVGIRIEG
jgi:hypothetical protein